MKSKIGILALILILFMGMVNAQSGEITNVKIHVIDTPSWLAWIAGDDEIEFHVTIKNTDTVAHTFQIQIWDATNSKLVLCEFGTPSPPVGVPHCDHCGGYTINLNPGDEGTEILTTDWRGGPMGCSLNSFKGIPIIKLIDGGDVIDEKVIPTYYENLTVFHKEDDELRNVSDPFNYAHHLILDEDCNVVGGDFCVPTAPDICKPVLLPFPKGYGIYITEEFDENPIVMVLEDTWRGFIDAILPGEQDIKIPLSICEKDTTYGIVDAETWYDIETKLPDGNALHYLLNQREYTSYETRTCEVEDYEVKVEDYEVITYLHQAQYKKLSETFFNGEELYKKLNDWYKELTDKLESLDDELVSEARANQVYCFKTHLKDTRTCYAVNYGWYSLTDTHPINETHPADSSYIGDIRRWNYDQNIDDMIA